jgi:hypothetical protein
LKEGKSTLERRMINDGFRNEEWDMDLSTGIINELMNS